MKYVLSLFLFSSLVFALSVVQPAGEIKTKGIVKDMVLKDDMLVIGTDSGLLQVYDTKGKKKGSHLQWMKKIISLFMMSLPSLK